jgi:hypothetical protein
VIDELDRLKESGNQMTRWRAGHTLGVLDGLLQAPRGATTLQPADPAVQTGNVISRGEVSIEVFFDQPRHERLADNDDEIIDRALAIQTNAGRKVRLLTMDTSMALRARVANVRTWKIKRDVGEEPTPPQKVPRANRPDRHTARSEPPATPAIDE